MKMLESAPVAALGVCADDSVSRSNRGSEPVPEECALTRQTQLRAAPSCVIAAAVEMALNLKAFW